MFIFNYYLNQIVQYNSQYLYRAEKTQNKH